MEEGVLVLRLLLQTWVMAFSQDKEALDVKALDAAAEGVKVPFK